MRWTRWLGDVGCQSKGCWGRRAYLYNGVMRSRFVLPMQTHHGPNRTDTSRVQTVLFDGYQARTPTMFTAAMGFRMSNDTATNEQRTAGSLSMHIPLPDHYLASSTTLFNIQVPKRLGCSLGRTELASAGNLSPLSLTRSLMLCYCIINTHSSWTISS